jgi:probable metal-binding protein
MPQSVHGHEVLEAILAHSGPIPRAHLAAAMADAHGADARYHTCSAQDMTLDELLAFLLERGKISSEADGIVAHREEMCAHG